MKKYNLCDTCKWCFAECTAKNIRFGEGIGNDNVVGCDKYFAKEYLMKEKVDCENFKDYPNMYAWITSRQFCDSDEVYTNGAELITVNDVLKGWNYYMNLAEQRALENVIDDERSSLLAYICKKYNIPLLDMNVTVDEWEEMKEKKNE